MVNPYATFDDQPELPSARVQTSWQLHLRAVHNACDRAKAHSSYNQGVGYVQALRDNDLINNTDEGVMSATLLRVWVETLERLDGDDELGQP